MVDVLAVVLGCICIVAVLYCAELMEKAHEATLRRARRRHNDDE